MEFAIPLITALIGGLISYAGTRINNKENVEATQSENEITREREDTAHTREVADLRNAGLNTLLSANGGATASSGGVYQQNSGMQELGLNNLAGTMTELGKGQTSWKTEVTNENKTAIDNAYTEAQTESIQIENNQKEEELRLQRLKTQEEIAQAKRSGNLTNEQIKALQQEEKNAIKHQENEDWERYDNHQKTMQDIAESKARTENVKGKTEVEAQQWKLESEFHKEQIKSEKAKLLIMAIQNKVPLTDDMIRWAKQNYNVVTSLSRALGSDIADTLYAMSNYKSGLIR